MTSGRRRWVPEFAGWAVAAAGAITILSSAAPRLATRLVGLERIIPLGLSSLSFVLAVVSGTLLLFLSGQLRKGRHRAWVAAVVLLSATTVLHVLKGLDLAESILAALLVGLLLWRRQEFRAAPDPPSLVTLGRAIPFYILIVLVYATTALWLNRNRISPSLTPSLILQAIVAGFVDETGPLTYHGHLFRRFFPDSLLALGIIGALGAVFLFFRPVVEGVRRRGPDDAARARDIVRRHGVDTLSYFALRNDKSYAFSPCGQAFLAYRYVNGLALVSGDPIGPPEACEELLYDFVEDARERSWTVAVLAGREALAPLYAKIGMRSYYLGDEAVINPQTFSLEGRPIRKVRQSIHRLTKAGYSTRMVRDPDVDDGLRAELEKVSRAWRKGAAERGFSMALGRIGQRGDPDCRILLAYDGTSVLRGYLHMVPCYGSDIGYSLDAMRREPDTPNGLTEYMICQAAVGLKETGATRFSLNFAVFARLLSDDIPLSPLQRLERALIKRFNPHFQIESLLTFNSKFFPEWVPRCIYYEDRRTLPRIAISYLQLESFVRLPFAPQLTAQPRDRQLKPAVRRRD